MGGMAIKRTLLTGAAASAVALGLGLGQASAQSEAGEPRAAQDRTTDVDEIVVVGTRQAIRNAVERKREADTFVDAISAEDIGQLPDLSVAESLERIAGVTATESRGLPAQLVVRGLSADFTQTTINGRELTNGQPGRAVTLGLYPSELITTAVVRKSAVADALEGGIAGTIDLETLRPLDRGNRRLLSANARVVHLDNQGEVDGAENPGWRGSIAYADKFADGRFGIALGASYIDQPLITDNIQQAQRLLPNQRYDAGFDGRPPAGRPGGFGDIDGDGSLDYLPNAALRYNLEGGNRKRLGLLGAVQIRATDTFEINADLLYADTQQDFTQTNIIVPFFPGLQFDNVTTDDAAIGDVVTEGGAVLRTGLVTGADLSNVRVNVENTLRELDEETISGGVNARFENDRFALSGDFALSITNGDRPFVGNTFRADGLTARYDYDLGGLPDLTLRGADFVNPTLSGNARQGFQPVLLNFGNPNDLRDALYSGRIDATYKVPDSAFTAVSAGVRYVDRSKSLERDVDGYGPGPLRGVFAPGLPPGPGNAAVAAAAADALEGTRFGRTFGGSGALTPQGTFFLNPETFLAAAGDLEPLGRNARDFTDGTYDVAEESIAGYVRADFEAYPSGRSLRGNVGLRVVYTDVVTTRVEPSFTAVRNEVGDLVGIDLAPLNEDTVQFREIENDYTNILPSLNVAYDLRDDLILRFAAGRTMSRPIISLIGQAAVISGADEPGSGDAVEGLVARGSVGNPRLDPYEADQLDLGLEWYPSQDLSLSANVFYKSVSNFVLNQSTIQEIATSDGSTVPFTIDGPVNDDSAEDFYGIELAYQQAFTFLPGWASGFGAQANYTWLDTTLENEIAQSFGTQATNGPSARFCADPNSDVGDVVCQTYTSAPDNFAEHTANVIGYYDVESFTFRVAGQYTSDVPALGLNNDQPRFRDGVFQLDASLAFDLTDNLRFIAAATNLTNEPVRLYYNDPNGGQPQDTLSRYTEFGTTYTAGLRARF